MESIKFKNTRDLTLAGNLYRADSKKLVILAHGFTNNKSSQGRFDRIAEALDEQNYNVLAFDFSGCGESDPDIMTAAKEVDDLNAAIKYGKSLGFKQIALFGNSLGTLICLRCFNKDIHTMVLMGALTHSMNYDWNAEFTKDQMDDLSSTGLITLRSEELGTRQLGQEMLDDFADIDQEKLLSRVTCPVLIIHGDNADDQEEIELLANSQKGMKYLSKESELKIIKGAKHGCSNEIDQVIDLTIAWIGNHL